MAPKKANLYKALDDIRQRLVQADQNDEEKMLNDKKELIETVKKVRRTFRDFVIDIQTQLDETDNKMREMLGIEWWNE